MYLQRSLLCSDNKKLSEAALISSHCFVIVLAEPGAGKTELMKSLAQQLNTTLLTANKLRYIGSNTNNTPLVIDAFDELAKVDNSAIYELLAKAVGANPTHIYLSSRSSEWDDGLSNVFREFTGSASLVVRLCPFEANEQRILFENYKQGESFFDFQSELSRFDLDSLLPNPQFLQLFADAYIESERHFSDKRSIFDLAIKHLAKESNSTVNRHPQQLPTDKKIQLSSEIFAKLLLAGAEGIDTAEVSSNHIFPMFGSLTDTPNESILATKLFKPSDKPSQHIPVHRIVAEYCAASYIAKRIADPTDCLTLNSCLSVIAPNSIVRDELRGLVGWIAALGNKETQETAIKLDPYAVLANGDPSQLEPSSKRLLIQALAKLEETDPLFRRKDFWRQFSVAGFFNSEITEVVIPIIKIGSEGHLRDLILELMVASNVPRELVSELSELVSCPTESEHTRYLATCCISKLTELTNKDLLARLQEEASNTSLSLAAKIIQEQGAHTFEPSYIAHFLRLCATLYPSHRDIRERIIGARYFIKYFIHSLDIELVEHLLDELTDGLTCTCNQEAQECDCRDGISKVVGLMLDRYFELEKPPFPPFKVWQWIKNLNFHGAKGVNDSNAVKTLQENKELRHAIITHVFGVLTDKEQIAAIKTEFLCFNIHSGLSLYACDYKFIVDLAFQNNNINLWSCFMAYHNVFQRKEDVGVNKLRQHMRKQALEKPLFMKEWARLNRSANEHKQSLRKYHFTRRRRRNRYPRQDALTREKNLKYFQDNYANIAAGKDFGCLFFFAQKVLHELNMIDQEVGDSQLVHLALTNCIDFIAPNIPSLSELAKLHCHSQWNKSVAILYAACLEIFRAKNSLAQIDKKLLLALRPILDVSYGGVAEIDRVQLKSEIDRLVFIDVVDAESFLRQYLEQQLEQPLCSHPQLDLLDEDVFDGVRGKLAMEWLKTYNNLDTYPLHQLFEKAVSYSNINELKEIISERIATSTNDASCSENQTSYEFWLLRAFFFLDEVPQICADWLRSNKESICGLYKTSSRLNRSDYPCWPKLNSKKIEIILDTFIEQWPKVELSSPYGSDSPKDEQAYRYLTEVIWSIESDNPDDALPVLQRLILDPRFSDLHNSLKSIQASQLRKKAIKNFRPPTPEQIVELLNKNHVITVEGLRQRIIEELDAYQKDIDGGEFNSANRFYDSGKHLDEESCTLIITERLRLRLEPQCITITPEHQLKSDKRSDFTASKNIDGKRKLLVTEVKGQWHKELYSAAKSQLNERYAIHPDAEQQGIYLILWFGADTEVAGRKKHEITNPEQLKQDIEAQLPTELIGLIDIFVLDISKV